jgi:hypothetical protein
MLVASFIPNSLSHCCVVTLYLASAKLTTRKLRQDQQAAGITPNYRSHHHDIDNNNIHHPIATVDADHADHPAKRDSISVAFYGGDVLYHNDMPRLMENMFKTRFSVVKQNSLMGPNATVWHLVKSGGHMDKIFTEPTGRLPDGSYDVGAMRPRELWPTHWEYVVVGDAPTSCARPINREYNQRAIHKYVMTPVSKSLGNSSNGAVVFIQPPGFIYHTRDIDDIGTFEAFTRKAARGMFEYKTTCERTIKDCRIARAGEGFYRIYKEEKERRISAEMKPDYVHDYTTERSSFFHSLYQKDGRYYTMMGTWLQACVVYCTILREEPPVYSEDFFKNSRIKLELPGPTTEQAEMLRQLAITVCREDQAIVARMEVEQREEQAQERKH